jgi:ABC-type nickel/cobalt efflux system permease component RcnA
MNLKVSLLALMAFAMALVLLIHFGCIWIFGNFYIHESNPYVLVAEISLISGILAFSFYCFVRELGKGK